MLYWLPHLTLRDSYDDILSTYIDSRRFALADHLANILSDKLKNPDPLRYVDALSLLKSMAQDEEQYFSSAESICKTPKARFNCGSDCSDSSL
jgi:hypothetical protein